MNPAERELFLGRLMKDKQLAAYLRYAVVI